MLLYKAWLEELNWEYKSKTFRFFLSESISSQFFSDYFSDEISNDEYLVDTSNSIIIHRNTGYFLLTENDYEIEINENEKDFLNENGVVIVEEKEE